MSTPVAAQRWRSLASWGHATCAALAIAAVVEAVVLVTELQQLSALSDTPLSASDASRNLDLARRIDSLNDAFLVTAFITLVVFITWMWRAAKNNEALGRQHPRFGPGWAIGGWFIPLANLVIPVLVMQDLWRGSDPAVPRGDMRWKIADRSPLVGWWWGLMLTSRAFYATGNGIGNNGNVADLRQGIAIQSVGTAASIAAAVVAILMVRRLSERQEECLRVQHEQWGQATAAPAPPS
jgi:hypothetical protein